jgi:hypothetical protein
MRPNEHPQCLRQDSDAKFRIKIKDGNGIQIDPRGLDLTILLYTSRSEQVKVSFGRFGALPEGVAFDGNDILLSVDRPPFPCGRLYARVEAHLNDATFPDEMRDESSGEVLTNIIVVK